MSLPQTRTQLKEWCLRKLGAPVLEINIEEEQAENRISEALRFFRDYHFDGIEKCYLKHQITASSFTLSSAATGAFNKNDVIVGQTSGATAYVYDLSENLLTLRFRTATGTFQLGENLVNSNTGGTATISATAGSITIGDIDNNYVPVSDRVVSIVGLTKTKGSALAVGAGSMFDFQYQWAMNNMHSFASVDLISYQIYKQYLALWNSMFKTDEKLLFNRKTDRLHIANSDILTRVDEYLVMEAWVALDPEEYKEIYSDEFVCDYATALLKQQWGSNLKKFSGIQLPGGVTLNGQIIYDEATRELETLVERVKKEYQLPPEPFIA